MGTRIVQTLVGAALLLAAALQAQEPPPIGNLLAQAKWLRFEITGGRIEVVSERCNQSQHEAEGVAADGTRQKLCVASAAARGFTVHSGLTMHYAAENGDTRLQLNLDATGQFAIRRLPAEAANSASVELLQSADKVTLAIGGQPPRSFEADNLWQLLLAERQACESHLLPMLAEFSLLGDLERQISQVEAALLASAGADVQRDRQAWQQCVNRLASPRFAERQAADQELRADGQAVLAFLRQLDPRQLSGEQKSRVRALLRDLPGGGPDTPAIAAQWLVADKRVWRALLARGELAQRIAAAEHLGHLCGRPIAFDPAASDERRAQQLAELSRMLADN
jgi:hypothetical protein